ncbi:UBX domain-containing protein 5 [Echria macrotheca]|uniref:UBX domain-containing protein 5 n=1 Tax=Echria macrotheca TaxID=438768 RepID=A0AAJ0FC19_9PEZI|nr:UBX domain-containing protein 5 [Echria macrotheca]
MADNSTVVADFMSITGASSGAALRILEMCGFDTEQAVQLWFNDEDLQRYLENPLPPAAASGPSTAASRFASRPSGQNRPTVGREDAQGVIHIDSDEEDDVAMTEDELFDDDDTAVAATVARTAQEEEDAAMAKRLQEEMYSGGNADDEDVRAPMARTTETLVAPSSFGGLAEADEDELLRQLRRERAAREPPRNPFVQTIWDDGTTPGAATGQSSRAQRLADLFRPPFDLISRLTWDEARDMGKETKKWILVNLQDMSDFNCQALNRDIWKDRAIKELVLENFIFLQFDKSSDASHQYISFYLPSQAHENPNNYPHVSIIDPRTGEQVKVWSGIPFPSASDFHSQLVEFLDRYSLAANSKNPVVKSKRPERVVDVDRMTEEEMLQLAMQNSLDANGSTAGQANLIDPDELTRSIGDVSSDKGKGKAVAEPEAAAPPTSASPFASIASDRPHVEPAADPKTTTRIQIRNPPSRIIRRFRLDEPVVRLFEWLKAEPLPGKEGLEFELKSVPQGTNLIDRLDQTIAEAGLANGTVMIEFVEPE